VNYLLPARHQQQCYKCGALGAKFFHDGILDACLRFSSMLVDGTLLSMNTLTTGFIKSNWSTVPALIDTTLLLALLLPNSRDPQLGQNRFVMALPLSAVWEYEETSPKISSSSSGTKKFVPKTEPVARRQSSQWQLKMTVGSAWHL
jgi:hypothetical protein